MRVGFFLSFLFIATLSFSQNIVCYAITTQGDTIKGIYLNWGGQIKKDIKLEDLKNRKKINIPFDEVVRFTLYKTGDQPQVFEKVKLEKKSFIEEYMEGGGFITNKNGEVFLRKLVDGKLKLYFADIWNGGYRLYQYYTGENNNTLELIPNLDFKSFFKSRLKDCPELAKKIDDKEYKFRDLGLIIEEYNACK